MRNEKIRRLLYRKDSKIVVQGVDNLPRCIYSFRNKRFNKGRRQKSGTFLERSAKGQTPPPDSPALTECFPKKYHFFLIIKIDFFFVLKVIILNQNKKVELFGQKLAEWC